MPPFEPLPWQQSAWQQLMQARDQLPHSLLLSGLPGMGKLGFAQQAAAGLLCQQPDASGSACGQCKACQMLAAGSHPDYTLIEPAEDSSTITVDQIRALIATLALRPHSSPQRVVILHPAEAMNINASNSLLKALEEPSDDSILVLVSHRPERLPATIRSRCSRLHLHTPPPEVAGQWLAGQGITESDIGDLLAASGGAPLRALQLSENGFQQAREALFGDLEALHRQQDDPVACAARWNKQGAGFCLGWFSGLLADLAQLCAMAPDRARLNNPGLATRLAQLAGAGLPAGPLHELLDRSLEATRLADTPLDDTLLIEDILIGWGRMSSKTRI